jgi:hypothetical protein
MSPLCLWAIGSDLPVNVLAVIGAFTVGGFLGGWAFALTAKLAFNQKVPNWLAWAVRLLSGLAAACVVWMWVFGSGGGGFGGSGFGLGGNGAGKDKDTKSDKDDKKTDPVVPPKDKDPDEKPKTDGPGIGAGETLRVEVLGDGPLEKLAGERKMDRDKRYRIADAPTALRTLEEIRKLILQRRSQTPPLRQLVVIIYSDSPDKDNPYVKDLVLWAKDLDDTGGHLLVEYTEPPRVAPLK